MKQVTAVNKLGMVPQLVYLGVAGAMKITPTAAPSITFCNNGKGEGVKICL